MPITRQIEYKNLSLHLDVKNNNKTCFWRLTLPGRTGQSEKNLLRLKMLYALKLITMCS